MLVLTRKVTETIHIGDDIKVTVMRIGPMSCRIGIDAPDDINIVRAELLKARAADDGAVSDSQES